MNRIERVRSGARSPGVYRWSPTALPATVVAALRSRGITTWSIDAAGAADKASFLQACAAGLSLPSWFGQNWDALADSLADLPVPPSGAAIVLAGVGAYAAADPDGLATALDVFRQACARPDCAPLWVLVAGDYGEPTSLGLASL